MTDATKKNEKEKKSKINNKSELKNEILSICEPMCLKIVQDKPQNIAQYMMKYLRNKYNYSSSLLNNDQKKELSQLKNDLQFFHEQEENIYYMEIYHKLRKEGKSPDKKNKSVSKQKQRLPPDEPIPSDDEDYNNPEEIDTRLDDINYIKENANQEIRPDYFEINIPNQKIEIIDNPKTGDVIEFLKINLIKSPLFSELSLDILISCIEAMNEEEHKSMSEIVKQGEYNDKFYFVFKGELECRMGFTIIKKEGNRTKVEKYDPKLVKVYYPGDYFCELNLLYYMPVRASIKAISNTILYTLDRKTYKTILNTSSIEKEKYKIELIKKLPIFETLLDEEFEQLSRLAKEAIFYKGETIIRENEYMNSLMIIIEGQCTGYKMIENGKLPKKTKDYREEDFFGKTALIKEELSEETIKASSKIVKFLCFDRNTIKNIFGSFEQILMRDIDIYEKYFPPIPEYSEQDNIRENTKSLLFSEENIHSNNAKNQTNEDINKQISNNIDNNIDNINNQYLQSRNTEKNNIIPEKINSLTYGLDGISKKGSKEKEEMYESEIKRLKEEVDLLQNKLNNRTYPEFNDNNSKENIFNKIELQENMINQENPEKKLFSSDINNMINNDVNNDQIINNNNINGEQINNNNYINDQLNNNIINNELNQQNINFEQVSNKDEIKNNLNISEENNKEINNNIEVQNQIKAEQINEKSSDLEEIKSEINVESNNQNNIIKNNNDFKDEEKIDNNNFSSNNNKINNEASKNNSKIEDKENNSQRSFKEQKHRNINKIKNLANLDIDNSNSSINKRTLTNKSLKNVEDFQIDSNNFVKNKKINSEKGSNDSSTKKNN